MKRTLFVISFLFLYGCVATAPSQSYRPKGEDNAWSISGELDEGLVSDSVTVKINGQIATLGDLDAFGNGTFTGAYNNAQIETICHATKTGKFTRRIDCMVLVDNERSATLTF